MTKADFIWAVCRQVPRATTGEWRQMAAELEAHIEDHIQALKDIGYEEEAAEKKAVAAMGEPREIGEALNAQLSPFWLWLGLAAKAVCFIAVIGLVYSLLYRFCPPFQTWAITGKWG